MRRELFIVARDRSDLYRYLSQTFADAENVEVIWDRRAGERRQGDTAASPERRRRQRRSRNSIDEELRTVGYAFLVLD
ncbi:MAG: hypothetical protein E6K82_10825 [Candidatus Rokuibacteriota bacterium]|nr:MAG: hypothetical protein E6K82_10825 [Candidatus Rokubacteria bacterium]